MNLVAWALTAVAGTLLSVLVVALAGSESAWLVYSLGIAWVLLCATAAGYRRVAHGYDRALLAAAATAGLALCAFAALWLIGAIVLVTSGNLN